MSKAKVLIVDDNPQWRAVLKESLVSVGEVYEAESYEETIRLLSSKDFDLAIVDLRLIDYDHRDTTGMSILAHLTRLKIPAIVMSAYGSVDTVRTAFIEYNIIDFFDKSNFKLVDFRNAIWRILKQTEQIPSKKSNRDIKTK